LLYGSILVDERMTLYCKGKACPYFGAFRDLRIVADNFESIRCPFYEVECKLFFLLTNQLHDAKFRLSQEIAVVGHRDSLVRSSPASERDMVLRLDKDSIGTRFSGQDGTFIPLHPLKAFG
jgi:hypothetical protein